MSGRKSGHYYEPIVDDILIFVSNSNGVSINEVAIKCGVGWSTAKRYLEYLEKENKVNHRILGKRIKVYSGEMDISDSDSVRLEKVKSWYHENKPSMNEESVIIYDDVFEELKEILYTLLSGYREVKIKDFKEKEVFGLKVK